MNKYILLKLLGLAFITMITLVILSFIEVAIYSYVINPGKDMSVYEAHAQLSAPYVSGIFGFIIFFLMARYWKKKGFSNTSRLVMLFPLMYVILDIIIILIIGIDKTEWSTFIWIFILANSAKFIGSYLGYRLTN